MHGDLTLFLQQDHTYDELLEKLIFYQGYRNKAMQLVDCWNFVFGK